MELQEELDLVQDEIRFLEQEISEVGRTLPSHSDGPGDRADGIRVQALAEDEAATLDVLRARREELLRWLNEQ